MKVVGIYLAAGKSERMGTNKLALPVGKMKLGSLALETALHSSLDKVFVICNESEEIDWMSSKLKTNAKLTIVKCSSAHNGQSESLKCGVRQAQAEKADAAMAILADQPFITVLMINEIIACMKKTPSCNYVATSYEQLFTPPVLFSAAMFPSLLNLTGDIGAKALLQGESKLQGVHLPCADNRFIFDVDTPTDFEEFLSIRKEEEQ